MTLSFEALVNTVGNYLTGPIFMAFLLGTGAFFTYYLRFPQFRFFRRAVRLLLGRERSEGSVGDTSPFRVLATSLAGSIGSGSIIAVCIALHIGGPGTLFWMWVTAFFGMATRIAESTASHLYREKSAQGTMVGGPMYVMQKRLKKRWMGVMFAISVITTAFLAGSMPPDNARGGRAGAGIRFKRPCASNP